MQRTIVSAGLALAVCVMLHSLSEAQVRGRWYRPGYGDYGGGYPTFSSTPMEGAARGMADVIRSSGEAAESASRAAINYQDAQSKYIDNKLKWTQTYWERKRLGEAERAKDYAEQREARELYLSQKQSGAPTRITPSQLDPATGEIAWPGPLMTDEFTMERSKLEELFSLRTQTKTTYGLGQQIDEVVEQIRTKLGNNIRDMRPNDFIAARKFLDTLAYEGQFPAT